MMKEMQEVNGKERRRGLDFVASGSVALILDFSPPERTEKTTHLFQQGTTSSSSS